MRARVRRLQRLSTQVVIMMVAILVVTLAAGFAVVQHNLSQQLNVQYEQRALAVAQALASQPGLQQAVSAGDPGGVGPYGVVQGMAMAAMHSTTAALSRSPLCQEPNAPAHFRPLWPEGFGTTASMCRAEHQPNSGEQFHQFCNCVNTHRAGF